MCTYNGAKFISEQLESIAAQQRPPDELVVCDDGSVDETREHVEQFARDCPFKTYLVVNDRRLGSTKNFEKAVSLCNGDVVALADQDDVWYPQKLQKIEKTFLEPNSPVGAFSDADLIDGKSKLLGERLWRAFSFNARERGRFANHRALEVLVKHPVSTGATMAFKRGLFGIVTPIPPNHIHDRWITFLLAARGAVRAIEEPLMQYRIHTDQQEGVPPQLHSELLAQARKRSSSFHFDEIQRFRDLQDRLGRREEDFPHAKDALAEIGKKISHLTRRAQLPPRRIARIPVVLQEFVNFGYWRYSAGWKSIARDLIIR